MRRSIRGATAVVGIGESEYRRHGEATNPEFVLCLQAILAACADAGIDPRSLDGFASFSDDRNESTRIAAALGVTEMRWSSMQWGGGGGGSSGAIQQAMAAVASGFADRVVVYRALSQGEFGRFGRAGGRRRADSYYAPYGVLSAAGLFASRLTRFFHETGISPDTQRAVALASYYHAQQNPRAVMFGRPLSPEAYDRSRWIVEPFHLYDCCQESDGAAALIVSGEPEASDLAARPVYVLGAAQGGGHRSGGLVDGVLDSPRFATSEFGPLAARLYEMADIGPADVDVVQVYENFTGAVVMALIELGFCKPEEAGAVIRYENLIAPTGGLPLNTSGGNLAEAYIHGLGLHVEAVRQLRGQSVNQVPDAQVGLVTGGPMIVPTSVVLYGTEAARG